MVRAVAPTTYTRAAKAVLLACILGTGLPVSGVVADLVSPDLWDAAAAAETLDMSFTAEQLGQGVTHHIIEPESGIGPGTFLFVRRGDGSGGFCSANFIWSDAEGKRYLGTAGHCLLPSGKRGTHGPDADYNPTGTFVYAVVEGCTIIPSTFVIAAVTCVEKQFDWVALGNVVFAVQGRIGYDFGLVHIPDSLSPLLRYEVPKWGGPEGESDLSLGARVLQYGHGLGWDATPATRARVAVGYGPWDNGGYATVGFSSPGDSGSGTVIARLDVDSNGLVGGPALGIHTHGLRGPGGATFGTLVSAAKGYALCYAGLSVWVEPGGTPLAGPPAECPPECPDACGPPPPDFFPGPAFEINGDATLQFVLPAGEPVDLYLRAEEPFRVELKKQLYPPVSPLAGILIPKHAIGIVPEPCANLPEDWSVFGPGMNQNPVHPAGEYVLRAASGVMQQALLVINQGGPPVDFQALTSGQSSLVQEVKMFEEETGNPIRISYRGEFATNGPVFLSSSLRVWTAASAGEHTLTVAVKQDGSPCAEETHHGLSATTPFVALNLPEARVAAIALPDEMLTFFGSYENVLGVSSPTGGPLLIGSDRSASIIALPLP